MSATAETGETARRLAALMDGMARCPACRICVVLNGNTFDFRSEQPASYLEAASAAEVVRRAVLAGNGAPFWDSLRRFLQQPDSHLAIVLGDREVELALPAARHWLVDWLAPDPAVRARVFTAFDGLGFECSVGGRRVLCLHGHEADAWNGVDQAQLLNLVRANRRRDKLPDWEPSVGVRLLVDVVGPMRARYPFLAGLGPMRSHLVPVLVALNPGLMRPIGTLLARQARSLDQGRL